MLFSKHTLILGRKEIRELQERKVSLNETVNPWTQAIEEGLVLKIMSGINFYLLVEGGGIFTMLLDGLEIIHWKAHCIIFHNIHNSFT